MHGTSFSLNEWPAWWFLFMEHTFGFCFWILCFLVVSFFSFYEDVCKLLKKWPDRERHIPLQTHYKARHLIKTKSYSTVVFLFSNNFDAFCYFFLILFLLVLFSFILYYSLSQIHDTRFCIGLGSPCDLKGFHKP